MGEIIKNIREIDGSKLARETYGHYEGYEIETDLRTIRVLVSSDSRCCEYFGYVASDDKLADYVGAEILKIEAAEIDEGDFNRSSYLKRTLHFCYEDGCLQEALEAAFVYIETDRGTLTLAVYNEHNGYYGHEVLITSTGEKVAVPDLN